MQQASQAQLPPPVDIDVAAAAVWEYPETARHAFRPYQHAICKALMHENTLVSLPTGFGKTLVAAVAMHNTLRWFPSGLAVFMCPSKPLAAQQIGAVCASVGWPRERARLLTGEISRDERRVAWGAGCAGGMMLFCTPQTLQNDLALGLADGRRVVCLVVDEAHHASGGAYAYGGVARALRDAGARCRVVALSATAGADLNAVQRVIDALRLSRLECRAEAEDELRSHAHTRHVDILRAPPPLDAPDGCALLAAAMLHAEESLSRLHAVGALPSPTPTDVTPGQASGVHAWVCAARVRERSMASLGGCRAAHLLAGDTLDKDCRLVLALLRAASAADAEALDAALDEARAAGAPAELGTTMRALAARSGGTHIAELAAREWVRAAPKGRVLCALLADHLRAHPDSRAIVFVHRRAAVAALCARLASDERTARCVRARAFVGQSARSELGGAGAEGMDQAAQQRALTAFRGGEFNVLVATSVAEEGLDIGEVDLIVAVDHVASPVRLVQRFGRTGRARDGRVVLLLSDAERRQYDKAREDAARLAQDIDDARGLRLCAPEPLLPAHLAAALVCRFTKVADAGAAAEVSDEDDAPLRRRGAAEGADEGSEDERPLPQRDAAAHSGKEKAPRKRPAAEPRARAPAKKAAAAKAATAAPMAVGAAVGGSSDDDTPLPQRANVAARPGKENARREGGDARAPAKKAAARRTSNAGARSAAGMASGDQSEDDTPLRAPARAAAGMASGDQSEDDTPLRPPARAAAGMTSGGQSEDDTPLRPPARANAGAAATAAPLASRAAEAPAADVSPAVWGASLPSVWLGATWTVASPWGAHEMMTDREAAISALRCGEPTGERASQFFCSVRVDTGATPTSSLAR